MAFLSYVRSIDKLFNHDWRSLFYVEPAETWQEKFYSFIHEGWTQFLSLLESRGRQFVNYWPVYAVFFTGTFIVLAIHKSLRYAETIESREKHDSERRNEEHERCEESKIISNVADEENECSVEESCSTSCSDLDSATTTRNNDQLNNRGESSMSSEITIVANENNEINNFLINLISSIEPGDDGVFNKNNPEDVENTKITDLQESTREKMDSEKCKQFYVLTPWLEPLEISDPLSEEGEQIFSSNIENEKIISRDTNFSSSIIEENAAKEKSCVTIELTKSSKSDEPILDGTNNEEKSTLQMGNLTLADFHESSSICCADEILSELSDSEENIVSKRISSLENFIKKTELETSSHVEKKNQRISSVSNNFIENLPELDLSPISKNSRKIENHDSIDIAGSVIRTDSKHRFRSLSYDSRTASSAEYLETRRGGSVSPPSRNKNKQRSTKQSKIPTLSPLAHRAMQLHQETDGSISETANQIRSALLRKLRQVWAQHPRDVTPNRSKNSSLDNSIYHTPEGVSRIPLPRRSPRRSNTNDLTNSPSYDDRCDRSIDQTNQSKDDYIDMTNEPRLSDNVSPVPLHSTPKSSHPPRRITGRR